MECTALQRTARLHLRCQTGITDSVNTYLFVTRCELASALMAAKVISVMKVEADFTMRNTLEAHLYGLITAGIPVLVLRHKSHVTPDKAVIIDNKIVVFGSVSRSRHAMSSNGHVDIRASTRPHHLKDKFQTCVATYWLLPFARVGVTIVQDKRNPILAWGLNDARDAKSTADWELTRVDMVCGNSTKGKNGARLRTRLGECAGHG